MPWFWIIHLFAPYINYSLIKLSILLILLLAITGQAGKKPNVIYILADDLGYGDLGCYGQQTIQTPQLDQMAADGIRKGKWKLILQKTGIVRKPEPELYNLDKDPSEQTNVARQNPEIVSELLKTIDAAHTLSEHKNFRLATEKPGEGTVPHAKKRK